MFLRNVPDLISVGREKGTEHLGILLVRVIRRCDRYPLRELKFGVEPSTIRQCDGYPLGGN